MILNWSVPGTRVIKVIFLLHHSCVLEVLNPSFPADSSSSENSKWAKGTLEIPEVRKVSKEKATLNQSKAN